MKRYMLISDTYSIILIISIFILSFDKRRDTLFEITLFVKKLYKKIVLVI